MDFSWPAELQAFREEVRAFAKKHRSPELMEEVLADGGVGLLPRGPRGRAFREEMNERGWQKMCLAKEYGGEGKSLWYRFFLVEECAAAGVPSTDVSIGAIVPALARFGTEEQKAKYLPGIYSGEITFAMGYSEPNAGSDLAALDTRAVRDGDEWVINGQKIWTSAAHIATHVWLAARTDLNLPKHKGISLFIVPMNSPGISVRPLPILNEHRTNEVFYDNVRVPADALVGELNRGWYIVMDALNHERVTIAKLGELTRNFGQLIKYIKESRPELLEDPQVRLRLAEIKVDLHVQRALKLQCASLIANGETPVMDASMTKVWGTELAYKLSNMALDLLGPDGALLGEGGPGMHEELGLWYLGTCASRFGGGANDIQRDIIAQIGLGLPR